MTKDEFRRYLQHSPVQNDGVKITEYIKKVFSKKKVDTTTSATVDFQKAEDWEE